MPSVIKYHHERREAMKTIHAENGVIYIKSDLIPCPHAFSTRRGGISRHRHTSQLNLAFNRGDSDDIVLENLRIFAQAAGFIAQSIVSLPQRHSTDVKTVTEDDAGLGYYIKTDESADGYATVRPGVTLGVKTADCVPILLAAVGPDGRAYAAAAIHAGWRGTVNRIAREGVFALLSLGAKLEDIRAAIGPAIGACCYEIENDVYTEVKDKLGKDILFKYVRPAVLDTALLSPVQAPGSFPGTPRNAPSGGISPSLFSTAPGIIPRKWFADLKNINAQILTDAGIDIHNIDISEMCTCCSDNLFFSHRRCGELRGTMLSVITLNN